MKLLKDHKRLIVQIALQYDREVAEVGEAFIKVMEGTGLLHDEVFEFRAAIWDYNEDGSDKFIKDYNALGELSE